MTATIVPDPDTANDYFLYIMGGEDTNGNHLNSIVYTTITVTDALTQSLKSNLPVWTTSSTSLSAARTQLKSWFIDGDLSAAVTDGDYWIYAGPGVDNLGTNVTNVDALKVNNDGSLSLTAIANTSAGNHSGYATATNGDNVTLYGGGGNMSSTSGKFTSICSAMGGGCSGISEPELATWNNTTNSLATSRIFPGFAQTGANIFIIGGTDDFGNATTSVERAIK